MNKISKFSVLELFSGPFRNFVSKCGNKGGSKGGSKGGGKGGNKGGSKGDNKDSACKTDSKGSSKGGNKDNNKSDNKACKKSDSKGDSKSDSKGAIKATAKGASNKIAAPIKLTCRKDAGKKSSCDRKKVPKTTKPPVKKSEALRRISLFVILPGIAILSALLFSAISPHEREEFKKWDHLRKRDKRFAWGDGNKSFFHNSHTNALPDGYEDED